MPTTPTAPTGGNNAVTYTRLFTEDWQAMCQPGTMEDDTGPIAYLSDLKRQVDDLEEDHADTAIPLVVRRPDLLAMTLDDTAMKRHVSSLRKVIDCLEQAAGPVAGSTTTIRDALATASNTPPFHYAWEQTLSVLKHRKWSIWDLVRTSDYDYPNFAFGKTTSTALRQALTMCSQFSPGLRTVLTAPAQTTANTTRFLRARYGMAGTTALADLATLETFAQRTRLDTKKVRQLLAVKAANLAPDTGATVDTQTAVTRSQYVTAETDPVTGASYGAAYVNDGGTPLFLEKARGNSGVTRIVGATLSHFDRIHRLLHLREALLRHGMKLSFPDLDLILISAFRAEGQTANFHITAATLRAIGLFVHMESTYHVTPEQFAAVIYRISAYANGREVSFYDRLFNPEGLPNTSTTASILTIDDAPFDPAGTSDNDKLTVALLCKALQIEPPHLATLLALVTATQSLARPTRSLAVVSACYRLVALPRLLKLTPQEGLALMGVLNDENGAYVQQLAGSPSLDTATSEATATPDIADVVAGLMNAAQWIKSRGLSAMELCSTLKVPPPSSAPRADWVTAVAKYAPQVKTSGTLRTEADLERNTDTFCYLPTVKESERVPWIQRLARFVEPTGVVTSYMCTTSAYVIKPEIAAIVRNLWDKEAQKKVDTTDYESYIFQRIEASEQTQRTLARNVVKLGFNLPDMNTVLLMIRWAGFTQADIIRSLLRIHLVHDAGQDDWSKCFSADDLHLWQTLQWYVTFAARWKRSPASMAAMFAHPDWFNLHTAPTASTDTTSATAPRGTRPLGLTTAYLVDRYQLWLGSMPATCSEQDALGYLEGVRKPDSTRATAAASLAVVLGWTVDDVLALTAQIPPKTQAGVAEDIRDIDYLMRLQALSKQTGLSTSALVAFNALKSTDVYSAFEQAVPLAMAGMSEQDGTSIQQSHAMAWRDALATWLLANWVPADAKRAFIKDEDDLSDYFLMDIRVGPEIETTAVASAIASLQLYIHRLFARLEPGFGNDGFDDNSEQWTSYLSQFARWRRYRQLQNHAENTIDPTRRRRKTKAFEELENALGQGKFASANVQTAMLGYLTSFEKVSNIQTLTGYADGTDPLDDTYHFIGKSNVEPAEYFWRTLDMSMRDEDGVPSMLAWSEWEAVTLPVTGEIVRTPVDPAPLSTTVAAASVGTPGAGGTLPKANTPPAVATETDADTRTHIDAIRPVVVAGRRYVVWVERDTVGIPMGADSKPSPYFALRVRYAYRQSDGLWSSANTLITLDGHAADGTFPGGRIAVPALDQDGKGNTAVGNAYLKTRDFHPGVVVMVNASDERKNDPWLTTMLFDTNASASSVPTRNTDYFLAARDLLLLEEKQLESISTDKKQETRLVKNWFTFFRDPRVVQHRYTGAALGIQEHDSYPHTLVSKTGGAMSSYGFLRNRPVLFTVQMSLDSKYLEIELRNRAKISNIWRTGTQYEIYAGPSKSPVVALSEIYLKEVAGRIAETRTKAAFDAASFPQKIVASLQDDALVEEFRKMANLGLISSSSPDFRWAPSPPGKGRPMYTEQHQALDVCLQSSGLTDAQKESFYAWGAISPTILEEIVSNIDMQPYPLKTFSIKSNPSIALTPGVEDYTVIVNIVSTMDDSDGERARGICSVRHIRLIDAPDDSVSTVRIRRNAEQVLYLDFTEVNEKAPSEQKLPVTTLRLNTLFGKRLVALASDSLDSVLSWKTQNLPEPAMAEASTRTTVDFRGANGMYFWELFFHVPFLVAWQFSEKGQYNDAWRWCTQYLFDPFRRRGGGTAEPPPYWNSVPLAFEKGVIALYDMTDDPDAYAYESPEHYRKAVFHFLVQHWRREGDQLYRQLTRDSLSEAWLCYQKALRLIGPLPEHAISTEWAAPTLADVSETDFVTPWNALLLDARNLLRHRLYTLRHGLTLDGKIASLPVYAIAEEYGLPGTIRTGDDGGRRQGHFRRIPHYRFRDALPRARDAVRQLIDMGQRLFRAIEDEGNYGLDVLRQGNLLEASQFTVNLQIDTLKLARLERDTLRTSKLAIEKRQSYFTTLYTEERSPREISASQIMAEFIPLTVAAATAQTVAGVVDSFPNIFGMANGGHDLGAVPNALAANLQMAAATLEFIGNEVRVQAEYDRRQAEWHFEAEQAACELDVLEKQLAEKSLLVGTAELALRGAMAQRKALESEYAFMTSGFAIAETYAWMVSQLTALYEPAYDAVHSLCRSAEACYQYETGDFNGARVRTDAWADGRRGMLAGESLNNDLDRMEADFLTRHERRLHIRKTLSLASLLSPGADEAPRKVALRAKVKPGGDLIFGFSQAMFDDDYPGHYLRQVLSVSVSFVLTSESATQLELSATLTQTSNALLVHPKIDGVKRLRSPKEGNENDIERDLRPRQQVAISTTRPTLDPETSSSVLCRLMFDDGRYLPFEGTGAVSNWQLHFGGTADAMKAVFGENAARLDDVLIHLNYTAADGGATFAADVAKVVAAASNTA